MIGWEVVGAPAQAGAVSTAKQAWSAATRAAVEVASKSGGVPVTLTVAGASATLYPALDEHGHHDPVATAAAAQLLLDDLDNEASTAQSGTPRPDSRDGTR